MKENVLGPWRCRWCRCHVCIAKGGRPDATTGRYIRKVTTIKYAKKINKLKARYIILSFNQSYEIHSGNRLNKETIYTNSHLSTFCPPNVHCGELPAARRGRGAQHSATKRGGTPKAVLAACVQAPGFSGVLVAAHSLRPVLDLNLSDFIFFSAWASKSKSITLRSDLFFF